MGELLIGILIGINSVVFVYGVLWLRKRSRAHGICNAITNGQMVSDAGVAWLFAKGLAFLPRWKLIGLMEYYVAHGDITNLSTFFTKVEGQGLDSFGRRYRDEEYDKCFAHARNASDAILVLHAQYGTHFTLQEVQEALQKDPKKTMIPFTKAVIDALELHPHRDEIGYLIAGKGWVNRLLLMYHHRYLPDRLAKWCLENIGEDPQFWECYFPELTELILRADDKERARTLLDTLKLMKKEGRSTETMAELEQAIGMLAVIVSRPVRTA